MSCSDMEIAIHSAFSMIANLVNRVNIARWARAPGLL